jgi:hypothetical protein
MAIFGNKAEIEPEVSGPKPLTAEDIERIASLALDDAVDFNESELEGVRELSDKYYQGETRLTKLKGRSQVIVTKVRDGVKSVIPSLARIFTQTDTVAEFYSDDEEDQQLCADATKYCNNVYHKYGGYVALIEGATDALKARVGVIKVTVKNKQIVSHRIYNKAELDNVIPLGTTTEESSEELVQTNKRTVKVWELKPLTPESFLISPDATGVDDALICAHQEEKRISDLVEMGLPYADLIKIPSSEKISTEDAERKGYQRSKSDGTTPALDPSSRVILYTEAYLRVDADGDGIAELRRLQLVGDNYKLMGNEPVNYPPFAVFKTDLQPHVFYPISLAEDLIQDQDAQTALLRSIVDNAALVNSPRTEVNEAAVNLDDVKNGEIGAIIRVRTMGQINELVTPFVAGQTLPVLQYLNEVSEARSGIVKLSQGLDADALQSTTKIAAAAAISAADARIEMMARNIGETGVKALFNCILRTAIYEANEKQSIQTPDGFKTVDPSTWHTFISVRTNVGLGSGRIDEKKMALQGVLPIQQMIIEKMGTANPICSWSNVRETLKAIMRLSGIHDFNKFFPYVAPEALADLDKKQQEAAAAADKEKQAAQQMQQQAMMELVKVENKKVEASYQAKLQQLQQKSMADMAAMKAEIMKLVTDNRTQLTDMYLRDDRERDKADMQFAIDAQKVGLDAQKVAQTEAKIMAEREAPEIESETEVEDKDETED